MKTLVYMAVFSSLLLSGRPCSALDFTDQGEYLGSSDCRSCHERFYKLWSSSHHGKAIEALVQQASHAGGYVEPNRSRSARGMARPRSRSIAG